MSVCARDVLEETCVILVVTHFDDFAANKYSHSTTKNWCLTKK